MNGIAATNWSRAGLAISNTEPNSDQRDEENDAAYQHQKRARGAVVCPGFDQAEAKKQSCNSKTAHVLYLSLTEAVRATWGDCGKQQHGAGMKYPTTKNATSHPQIGNADQTQAANVLMESTNSPRSIMHSFIHWCRVCAFSH
jgi:hypothetical protein